MHSLTPKNREQQEGKYRSKAAVGVVGLVLSVS